MDDSFIKSAEELIWVLRERNIRPNKTIVVSCNTGNWASAAMFMLRYLGYPDVRLHDESWINWMD
jgi:3-mercaptopyruvate sulfurtransferase SseA